MYDELDKYIKNTEIIHSNVYEMNESFNIQNKSLYRILVNFYLHLYNKSISTLKDVRIDQENFKKLVRQRDKKCIITSRTAIEQLKAAHIVPHANGVDFSIDNGLLLNADIHDTLDAYKWAINPKDLTVDILCKDEGIVGTIYDYAGKRVNIEVNSIMRNNLEKRWLEYMERKLNYKN